MAAAALGEPLRHLWSRRREDVGSRIFYHNIWFRGHNNPRYATLLPRLDRLDLYLVTCSDRRIVRGLEYRALRATRRRRNRAVFGAAARRYRYAFCTNVEQVAYFDGPVVVDMDDPFFTPTEVELLKSQNVAAYVVTNEDAAEEYRRLGVTAPSHVIPQGVDLGALDPARVDEIARRRDADEVVVGYVAAWHLTAGDRGGDNPLYNCDHLFDLWHAISARLPRARLRIIGQSSERVRRRAEATRGVELLGRLGPAEVLAQGSNFDVALYPRRIEHARFPVKMAEYLGLGVPTVAYRVRLTRMLTDSGGGVEVSTPDEFVDAVVDLCTDVLLRTRYADAARRFGSTLDWGLLADRYAQLLDEYLPA